MHRSKLETHDAQNRKREGLKAFGSGRGPHRGPPAAAPPAAARTESAVRPKRVHVGYLTITGTRKTLPRPRNKQKKTYPGEEQTKPPQNKKKPNRCGNHKGHSRSLTPPIKKPSRRGATSAPRDLHTILPHLPKMRRSALPTSAEKKRRARVELGKEAFQERSTVGDHPLRRLFCLGLRRLRLNHACPLETKTMSASGTPPLQLRPRHVVAGMPKQRNN